MPAVPGTLLPSRYGDVRPIARGGMGEIYRATDLELGREVAVKLLAERYSADADSRGTVQTRGARRGAALGRAERGDRLRCRGAQRPATDRHGVLPRRLAGGADRRASAGPGRSGARVGGGGRTGARRCARCRDRPPRREACQPAARRRRPRARRRLRHRERRRSRVLHADGHDPRHGRLPLAGAGAR